MKEDHGGLDLAWGTEHKYKYPKINLNANIYRKLMKKSLGITPPANAAKGKHKEGIEGTAIQLAEENLKLKHEIKEWEHKYKRIEEESMNLDRMIFEKEDLRKEIQKLKEGSAYQKGKQIEDNEDEEEINMHLIDETQKVLTLSSPEPTSKRDTQDLVKLYRVKVEEINERTKIGLRLDILHEAERLLGQIQNEAAQQAIKSLQ
ncbi:hypothetical protein ZIOFF_069989 [Zingiber officinale]|uniref:Uncharacterized protein n=1 Tax=Zingiber officinale TaxID=94328 RepID=A0A8J5ES79_ZINOF|nr:hypothetical protein ZIOFF_069989 [Zingiber officinale]